MGTPDFAVASAEAIVAAGIEIACIVTVPDRHAGRGRKICQSAMKEWAVAQKLPILQPESLKDAAFIEALKRFDADLFIVVAFRILPREVFSIPALGTINLHGSLLPRYRGAAPINWAIIQGERETGVTTFFIDDKVDTGNILLKAHLEIGEDEDFGELYDRLKIRGASLLVETIEGVMIGGLKPFPQSGTATRAPKITPEVCTIDWSKSATEIRNVVRGLSPVPGARSRLNNKGLKIFSCTSHTWPGDEQAGTVCHVDCDNGALFIRCGEGAISVKDLQVEGKRRMAVSDFLRGCQIKVGDALK